MAAFFGSCWVEGHSHGVDDAWAFSLVREPHILWSGKASCPVGSISSSYWGFSLKCLRIAHGHRISAFSHHIIRFLEIFLFKHSCSALSHHIHRISGLSHRISGLCHRISRLSHWISAFSHHIKVIFFRSHKEPLALPHRCFTRFFNAAAIHEVRILLFFQFWAYIITRFANSRSSFRTRKRRFLIL